MLVGTVSLQVEFIESTDFSDDTVNNPEDLESSKLSLERCAVLVRLPSFTATLGKLSANGAVVLG